MLPEIIANYQPIFKLPSVMPDIDDLDEAFEDEDNKADFNLPLISPYGDEYN